LLEDIRCWLLDRIDGSEETKGDDGLISDFIRKLDALSSDMGTIPDAERKKVMDAHLAATVEPRGCPTPGSCSAVEELADLKQRLLPQFQGRAERAESHLAAAETQLQEAWRQVAQTMDAPRSATAAPSVWTCVYNGLVEKPCKVCDCEMKGYAPQAAPVEEVAISRDLWLFLKGESTLDGFWFGEYPIGKPHYWWRSYMKREPDRPDWARQLPGAELYDRDHGYDRTASLNAGKYVCLCGGTCSHYDAQQQQEKP
jgi:hypothetical protein